MPLPLLGACWRMLTGYFWQGHRTSGGIGGGMQWNPARGGAEHSHNF